MRTTYCGLVSEALMGQTVTLTGWAHRRRDHGGVIFIDLRDREGLVQVVCDPDRAEMFATNIFGQWWLRQWNRLLHKIPIVRSVYSSVKQVSDTLFSSSGNAFREAVLVQYPRHGSWTIAFVTGKPGGEVAHHLAGTYVSVYVPTTPNPTGGHFVMVRKSDCVELDMSVDAALRYIVSMGVVAPNDTVPAHLK